MKYLAPPLVTAAKYSLRICVRSRPRAFFNALSKAISWKPRSYEPVGAVSRVQSHGIAGAEHISEGASMRRPRPFGDVEGVAQHFDANAGVVPLAPKSSDLLYSSNLGCRRPAVDANPVVGGQRGRDFHQSPLHVRRHFQWAHGRTLLQRAAATDVRWNYRRPVDYRALRISVVVRLERYAAVVGTAKSRVAAFAQLLTSKSKAVFFHLVTRDGGHLRELRAVVADVGHLVGHDSFKDVTATPARFVGTNAH